MRLPTLNLAACLAALCVASPGFAQSPPTTTAPPASSSPDQTPNWVQVAQDSQRTYYLEKIAPISSGPVTGKVGLRSLMEFKIPQVFEGIQVWSIVSDLQLDCDRGRTITLGDAFFSGKMGAGRSVTSHAGQDAWHAPAPGSLGEMAWDLACGKAGQAVP